MGDKRVNFGKWSLALLLGSASVILWADGSGGVTLEDAVRLAATTNPEVRSLAADRRAIDHELRQARAGYFPSLDFRGATGEEYTDDPGTRALDVLPSAGPPPTPGIRTDDTWLWRTETSLTLRQLLFDGFETDSEVERQLARVDSAAFRVGASAETIGLNAALAYLDVLRWQALVRIAEDNVRAHQATLADVRRIVEAGRGTVADVRQTEARVAAARATLVQTQGALQDTEANYLEVVGEPPEALVRPVISDAVLPANRETAAELAVRDNPIIAVAKADIETAKAERKAARAPFWPRLDIELGSQWNKNIDGVRGHERDFTALVVLRYNLYRGGADTARRQEFIERALEAEELFQEAKRVVAEEARLSWNAMMTARGRAVRLAEQVEANEGVVEAYREQFIVGQRDLLDLLDAQNELFLSRGNFTTEEYAALFSAYRVLAAAGILLRTLGIEPPMEGRLPALQ